MNKKLLNILILEDNPDDAELMVAELEKEGYIINWNRVDTEQDFKKSLKESPDLILADYKLPLLNALDALKIKQEIAPAIPLIIVSGAIEEEFAVECIKAGATDYVLKDRLYRLCPVIERALKEAGEDKERKQADEELRDSEERLKILFDYAPDAYYISDIKGKFIDGNKAAERLIGYKKEELIGKSFLKLKLLSLADIPKAAKLLVKNLRGQPTGSDELVLNRKDNSKVTVEISTYPVKIKGKTLALGIARDITERKKAEEALRKSQQEFASIFHNNPEALLYLDDKDTVLEINSRFSELFGYNLKEIKGKDINSGIIHPPDKIEEAKRLTKKAIKGYINYDTIRKKKDGTLFPASVSGSSVLIDGKTKGRIILYQDITQRQQAEQKIKQGYEKLQRTMEATIYTISKIIETKDPYTAGHQNTVSQLAVAIAQEMKLPEDKIEGIRIAALVHDIGKINIPAEILSKPSKLNDMEFSLIKNHSKSGYDILRKIDFSWPVAKIVLQHHEKINGSGYPGGLKGDEILLEAKIIGVADVVEAISSHRPYRPALGIDKALEEISQNRGILYDPMVVDVCLNLFKEKDFEFKL
ncbi:MAG: PAS domain S-box protein [Atribacterota bacterium]